MVARWPVIKLAGRSRLGLEDCGFVHLAAVQLSVGREGRPVWVRELVARVVARWSVMKLAGRSRLGLEDYGFVHLAAVQLQWGGRGGQSRSGSWGPVQGLLL